MAQIVQYAESEFGPCVAKCEGCANQVATGKTTRWHRCRVYLSPEAKFRNGAICPMATHLRKTKTVKETKRRVGQQKQKKGRRR